MLRAAILKPRENGTQDYVKFLPAYGYEVLSVEMPNHRALFKLLDELS